MTVNSSLRNFIYLCVLYALILVTMEYWYRNCIILYSYSCLEQEVHFLSALKTQFLYDSSKSIISNVLAEVDILRVEVLGHFES